MKADASLLEHVSHGIAEGRPRDGIGCGSGVKEMNAHLVSTAAPSKEVREEHGALMWRSRALVGQCTHDDRHGSRVHVIECRPEARRAGERIERVPSGCEAWNRVGREFRTQRDDQIVIRDGIAIDCHPPVHQIDGADVALPHLYPWAHEIAHVTRDLLRLAVTRHDPEKRWRKRVSQVPLDDRDMVLVWKQPSEFVGDHLAPNAAAQDENGFRVRHGFF